MKINAISVMAVGGMIAFTGCSSGEPEGPPTAASEVSWAGFPKDLPDKIDRLAKAGDCKELQALRQHWKRDEGRGTEHVVAYMRYRMDEAGC